MLACILAGALPFLIRHKLSTPSALPRRGISMFGPTDPLVPGDQTG